MKVLRGMRPDEDGLPMTGATGRTLDARPSGRNRDIEVMPGGLVQASMGGMSVSPPPPTNLPEHRRPPEYGGIGADPVYELETDDLPPRLRYRPDPNNPMRHGFIEPARTMSFEDYQRAMHATRARSGNPCDNS